MNQIQSIDMLHWWCFPLFPKETCFLRNEHLTWHKGRDHYIKPIFGESNNAKVNWRGFPNTLPETNSHHLWKLMVGRWNSLRKLNFQVLLLLVSRKFQVHCLRVGSSIMTRWNRDSFDSQAGCYSNWAEKIATMRNHHLGCTKNL